MINKLKNMRFELFGMINLLLGCIFGTDFLIRDLWLPLYQIRTIGFLAAFFMFSSWVCALLAKNKDKIVNCYKL